MLMLQVLGASEAVRRGVAADFEGEVDRGDHGALRLDFDAYGRDRVPFLLVDAFDAGDIADDRIRGPQGAVRKIRPDRKMMLARRGRLGKNPCWTPETSLVRRGPRPLRGSANRPRVRV